MRDEIEKLVRELKSDANQFITDDFDDGYAACAGSVMEKLEAILNRQGER